MQKKNYKGKISVKANVQERDVSRSDHYIIDREWMTSQPYTTV